MHGTDSSISNWKSITEDTTLLKAGLSHQECVPQLWNTPSSICNEQPQDAVHFPHCCFQLGKTEMRMKSSIFQHFSLNLMVSWSLIAKSSKTNQQFPSLHHLRFCVSFCLCMYFRDRQEQKETTCSQGNGFGRKYFLPGCENQDVARIVISFRLQLLQHYLQPNIQVRLPSSRDSDLLIYPNIIKLSNSQGNTHYLMNYFIAMLKTI